MSPYERLFKKEYALVLFSIAEADFTAGEVLARHASELRLAIVLFQFQQAVEKALKAVLCSRGKAVPFSHDLEVTLVLLGARQPPFAESLKELSPFATVRRYEEGSELLDSRDVENVRKLSRAVLDWAKSEIGGPGKSA